MLRDSRQSNFKTNFRLTIHSCILGRGSTHDHLPCTSWRTRQGCCQMIPCLRLCPSIMYPLLQNKQTATHLPRRHDVIKSPCLFLNTSFMLWQCYDDNGMTMMLWQCYDDDVMTMLWWWCYDDDESRRMMMVSVTSTTSRVLIVLCSSCMIWHCWECNNGALKLCREQGRKEMAVLLQCSFSCCYTDEF